MEPQSALEDGCQASDTRYFVDPSLAAASLRIDPNDLMNDLNTFGFFFESIAVRGHDLIPIQRGRKI